MIRFETSRLIGGPRHGEHVTHRAEAPILEMLEGRPIAHAPDTPKPRAGIASEFYTRRRLAHRGGRAVFYVHEPLSDADATALLESELAEPERPDQTT